MKSAAPTQRGRPLDPAKSKTGENYQFAEWLTRNLRDITNLTNAEIADELGYTHANIVSMWSTGRTKVPLPTVFAMAKLFKVDVQFLLSLWAEQYAGKAGYAELLKIFHQTVSEEEAEYIEAIREVTDGKKVKLTATKKKALQAVFK